MQLLKCQYEVSCVRMTRQQLHNIVSFSRSYTDDFLVTPVYLRDGSKTTIYAVRYRRSEVRPKVVVFDELTALPGWCQENGIDNAMIGGYDLHHTGVILGEVWTEGAKHPSVPIANGWTESRGCLYVDTDGEVSVSFRSELPLMPLGHLLQAGPVLLKRGLSLMIAGVSPEGFSDTAEQFSPDPSVGRHPRAAIGYNDEYVWSVVCDGRAPGEAGLELYEMADVLLALGATDALNLDGGSSTTLVHQGCLRNNPRGQQDDHYPDGLPIKTAIVFERAV